MSDRHDTLPPALPTRISDDLPAEYEVRSYVTTGKPVTSNADVSPGKLPAHVELPPRAAMDVSSMEVPLHATAPQLTSVLEARAGQIAKRVFGLCEFVDSASPAPSPVEQATLRADARLLQELVELVNTRLAQVSNETEEKLPAATPASATRVEARSRERKK